MDTLIRADIFFFVTTVVVITLGIGLGVLIVYAIRILRDARHITDAVRHESDTVIAEIDEFRKKVRRKGVSFKRVSSFVGALVVGKKKRRRKISNF